jgi:putative ABC transport system permease protein
MKSSSLFYLSLQNFKNRKSRALFTILGVAVSIGAILFLVSLGYGLQQNLLQRITTKESLLTLDVVPSESKVITLTTDNLDRISRIENVKKVSPQAVLPAQVSLVELNSETTVNLVNADFFSLAGLAPEIGQVFTEQDERKIVVNSSVAELFNLKPEEILGKNLKFVLFLPKDTNGVAEIEVFQAPKEFEVIGVTNQAGGPSQAYLKMSDLPGLSINEFQLAKVQVVSDKTLESVREKLIGMGFLVSALSDTIAQANKIFGIIQIVLGIFGVIALVVAAIGLINTMTISLLERTNEIGIMRAIGASSQDIKRLFLAESLMIGFLGGVGGIGIGIVIAEIFNWGINILAFALGGRSVDLFAYPGWFIIFIIILSTIVGFLAGFWPARRAAKLNPLAALRYK